MSPASEAPPSGQTLHCPLPLLQNMNKRVRCPCGRAICLGHHNYTTTSTVQAAQPQAAEEAAYTDPDCVSTDLVSRHQVGRPAEPPPQGPGPGVPARGGERDSAAEVGLCRLAGSVGVPTPSVSVGGL